METRSQNGEITFQSIWALIKKSGLRILIYVLIVAIIVGGVTALFMLANSGEPEKYQAMLEFNFEGVEDGLDPWGRSLDVSDIKSDSVVTEALVENDFSEEQRTELKSKLINNISISGIVPEETMNKILITQEIATKNPSQLTELINLSYFSTSYVVSLTNDKKMKLNSSECIAILNSIVDNYIKDFKEKYGYSNALGTVIAEEVDYENYDYIELYDLYSTQIDSILSYLDKKIAESNTFRATDTKLTFEDMRTRVNTIREYSLKAFDTFILENGVTRSDAPLDVQVYIQEKLDTLNRELAIIDASLSATQTSINNFEFVYNTTSTENNTITQTLANGNAYDNLYKNLLTYQSNKVSKEGQISLWTDRKDKFNAAVALTPQEKTEATTTADAMIINMDTKLKEEIGYINSAVNEYIDVEVMKNSVIKAVSANKQISENFSFSTFAIIEILAIFVAFLIALGVTSKRSSKLASIAPKSLEKTEDTQEKE